MSASQSPIRPTRVELDLGALRGNLAQIRRLAPAAEVMAVVKANAYGHGALAVASALVAEGVRHLGVALVEEGVALREAGITASILVLGGAYEGGYEALMAHQLTPVIFRPEHLAGLSAAARRAGKKASAHLKLDTGMGRIGLLPSELVPFLRELKRQEVELEGVLSHFANADGANREMTVTQISRFREALAVMEGEGWAPRFRHLANSAAVLSLPEVRDGLSLNMVRPGLMLYGTSPASHLLGNAALSPVLTWKTAITHLKEVPAGTPISYGGTFVTSRPSRIATLPVGYADGYLRAYSNKAQVLIAGRRAPIVGRVCMDMCMVDVTDFPSVQVGEPVVLLGRQGPELIPADELAAHAGTINYEVLCAIGGRVPRQVVAA